jgi:hypothetical protein
MREGEIMDPMRGDDARVESSAMDRCGPIGSFADYANRERWMHPCLNNG